MYVGITYPSAVEYSKGTGRVKTVDEKKVFNWTLDSFYSKGSTEDGVDYGGHFDFRVTKIRRREEP